MKPENQHIALIIKHLSGEASDAETQLLFTWLEESAENKALFDETGKAWEITQNKIDPEIVSINIDDEWNRIETTLGLKKEEKIFKIEKTAQKSTFGRLKLAAVILLFITVGGLLILITQSSDIEIVANNSVVEKTLPDNSTIVLKKYAEISYKKDYNKAIRKIKLKGEAFFQVEPDKSKPFIVEAGKLKVEVLGTSFLVKNYEQNKFAEVIVESGRVMVYTAENKSDSIILLAGDKAEIDGENNQIMKSVNSDQNYIAWKTHLFNFENQTLSEVVKTINHAYNSDIVIQNKSLGNCTITVTFESQSLQSVLNVLKATLNIEIRKKGSKFEISGDGCKNEQNE